MILDHVKIQNLVAAKIVAALVELGAKAQAVKSGDPRIYHDSVIIEDDDRSPRVSIEFLNTGWRTSYNYDMEHVYVSIDAWPNRKKVFKTKKATGLDYKAIAQCILDTTKANNESAERRTKVDRNAKRKRKIIEDLQKTYGSVDISFDERLLNDDYDLRIHVTGDQLERALDVLKKAGLLK
jgi:hypothetical protein